MALLGSVMKSANNLNQFVNKERGIYAQLETQLQLLFEHSRLQCFATVPVFLLFGSELRLILNPT